MKAKITFCKGNLGLVKVVPKMTEAEHPSHVNYIVSCTNIRDKNPQVEETWEAEYILVPRNKSYIIQATLIKKI